MTGPGRLRPGSVLLHTTTTEPPRAGLPRHAGQDVAGYSVQPFAVRDSSGLSVVLVNKYEESQTVSLTVPDSFDWRAIYRFDAVREADALAPLVEGSVDTAAGAPLAVEVPGLSVTVVSLEARRPTGAGSPSPTAEFRLLPAVPNPSRGATRLTFELNSRGHVRLEVVAANGRHVATVAERAYPSGTHSVTFDPQGLPPGVYFSRLCVDDVCESRPVVYVR